MKKSVHILYIIFLFSSSLSPSYPLPFAHASTLSRLSAARCPIVLHIGTCLFWVRNLSVWVCGSRDCFCWYGVPLSFSSKRRGTMLRRCCSAPSPHPWRSGLRRCIRFHPSFSPSFLSNRGWTRDWVSWTSLRLFHFWPIQKVGAVYGCVKGYVFQVGLVVLIVLQTHVQLRLLKQWRRVFYGFILCWVVHHGE